LPRPWPKAGPSRNADLTEGKLNTPHARTFSVLQEIGTIIRRARSGMVIVRLAKEPHEGQLLFDSKGRSVGRVTEIFGPVKGAYASLLPHTDRIEGLVGEKVFSRN
jgi:rRNA processing protein Gar1